MTLRQGDPLLDGWVLERLAPDGSCRFVRAPTVDRRRAVSRLVVMGGCLAVTLALVSVSAQSSDSLWLVTWSLVVLFGVTALLALLAAVKDLRRAALGVFLEIDVPGQRVRGVLDGAGFAGQFQVATVDLPRSEAGFSVTQLEEATGAAMLVVTTRSGRLLAPDLPSFADARALVARLG